MAFLASRMLNFIYEKHLKKRISEAAMASGLLFNIGMVFFLNSFPQKYIKVLKRAEVETIGLNDIEVEELSINHCQAGGYLLKWWDLPFPIVEASLFHQTPLDERIVNKELLYAIHIAEKYAYSGFLPSKNSVFYREVFDLLKIDENEFEESLNDFNL